MRQEGEPQAIFVKWVFPSILLVMAFAFLAAMVACIAIELRETKRAEAERTWRNAQLVRPD